MVTIGLTGGIGAGKSTVAQLLGTTGADVVDLDSVAKAVMEPGGLAYEDLVREFPEAFAGGLDRRRLAALVFADAAARDRLNAIVHPAAWAAADAAVAASTAGLVVVESALLYGSQNEDAYDGVLVVTASEDVRVRRLVEGRGLTESDARARIAAQVSQSELVNIADYVIDNSGSRDDLASEVARMLREWRLVALAL